MAEHHVRVNVFSSALVVGLCVVASVVASMTIAGRSVREAVKEHQRKDQMITVRGSARQRIVSDMAVWRIRVRAESAELAQAYAAIESGAAKVAAFLAAQGFKPTDMEQSAISTETHYARDEKGNPTRRADSYELAQSITVTSGDCAKVAGAARQVTQLIRDGVQVISCLPEFTYSRLPDLRVTILGEAAKDARARADEIARNSGSQIGEVQSAQTGILQLVQPNSTDVSGGGQYDTATIEKDATVVVTLTFAVREK
jgi:hypothetical protein